MCFVLFLLSFFTLAILSLAATVGLFFLFRKKKAEHYKEQFSHTQGILLSPIDGTVKSIKKAEGECVVKMEMAINCPYGLYLPTQSELVASSVDSSGPLFKPFNIGRKFAHRASCLEFEDRLGVRYKLRVSPFLIGMVPRSWMFIGDKGLSGGNFGFLPLGGSVELIVPDSSEIVVSPGEKILSGRSTLVAINRETYAGQ